ncbi:MAG: hypothetical protein U0163_20935 [Gemmatimonadaceae bacterium]
MSYTARSHQRTRRLLALLMVLHVPCVHAQRSGFRPGAIPDEASPVTTPHRTGISLGVYSIAAPGVTITGADVDGEFKTKSGGGAGVVLGIGVTPLLSVFASIDIAKQQSSAADYDGTFGLAHAEAGVQLNLATQGARTVPYLLGSIGRRGVGAKVFSVQDDADVDMTLTERALSLGGGISTTSRLRGPRRWDSVPCRVVRPLQVKRRAPRSTFAAVLLSGPGCRRHLASLVTSRWHVRAGAAAA